MARRKPQPKSQASLEHELSPDERPRQRVRLFYEKGETVKFISHLDEFRLWERTLRRADLPLLYKMGFNPQPHIQFASPLGVGFTGVREPVDITFCPPLPLDEIQQRIADKLPPGVRLHEIQELPVKTKALQSLLIGADYQIVLYAEPGEIDDSLITDRIETFLAQNEIWRTRERKKRRYTYNLRPLILELRYDGYFADEEEHRIFLRVQQREGATGRPDEVVSELGFDNFARTLCRKQLYISTSEADVALFAQYPVVTKQDIEHPESSGQRSRRGRQSKRGEKPMAEGRSISERAGDEFN